MNIHKIESPILVAPSPTPFTKEGRVDYKGIENNAEKWLTTELSGFVLGTENGLYFGYLFGDAQFSNHDNKGANIYFCVRKKQVHEKRIPANWN